jgi:uncharacterized membrane protein
MGIVTRLRTFHKEKHQAALAGRKQEVLVLQAQIKSIEHRATKIKNAFFYTLLGIIGIMATCLVLGLTLYVQQALVVAILMFVFSVLSMLVVHQTVKVRDYKNESIREFTVDSDTN